MKPGKIFDGGGQFIVVTGQIGDGFEFTGPFAGYDSACEWASGLGESWFIEELHTPTSRGEA